jgi:sugar (pentulose or hexulose) kinase
VTAGPTFLGIDLGTTSIKGAVLATEPPGLSRVLREPFPEPTPGLPPSWVEIEPAAVIAAARRLLERLLPHAPGCAGVLLCGQMGGLVLTDARGVPLSRYLSWRDQRLLDPVSGGTWYDQLLERLSHDHRRQLGQEVRPGATLSYLFWLAQAGRLPAGAYAATLPDFVAAHLCGRAPVAHPTLAIGLLNLESQDWHHPVFGALGLGDVRWPRLAEFTQVVGAVNVGGQALPCYAPVGDQQCALAGAALTEGELSLNLSTGSQASRLTPRLELGNYQTRPYFDGHWLNTLTHLPAGRALNALLALFNELPAAQGRPLDDPWPYLERAAAAVPATDLDVSLAFFPGPAGERGHLANLHGGNLTLGHLVRGAYNHLAANYHAAARRLWPASDWTALVFSGGLAQRSPLLRALIANRLGGATRLVDAHEETLVGLLALARVAAGLAPSALGAAVPIPRLPPQPSHGE